MRTISTVALRLKAANGMSNKRIINAPIASPNAEVIFDGSFMDVAPVVGGLLVSRVSRQVWR